jgi:hypothetical protein
VLHLLLSLPVSEVRPVKLQSTADPVGDPVGGVDRGVRILEDQRDVAAVGEPLPPRPQPRERPFLEVDLPLRRPVDECEEAGDGALAAAALADERDDLAAVDRELDVVDGVQRLRGEEATDAEVPGQADRPEQGLAQRTPPGDTIAGSATGVCGRAPSP